MRVGFVAYREFLTQKLLGVSQAYKGKKGKMTIFASHVNVHVNIWRTWLANKNVNSSI